MTPQDLLRDAARCWERAGRYRHAAERYVRADAWAEAGRCWAGAGRSIDAADAYARADEPIQEARQWLTSPWSERARRPYQRALESQLGASAEIEARLGLGEIDLASDCAFGGLSGDERSVDALHSLARLAAARGRPDLAARAWEQAKTWGAASTREVFEDQQGASPWNLSLGWERFPAGSSGWPSQAFRDVRLELVWEEELSSMMYGNRGLAWSADGMRFAAARPVADLILGELAGREVCLQTVEMKALSAAFVPESESVLVGCVGGDVVRVDPAGTTEVIESLKMPSTVWGLSFSPQGDHVAVTNGGDSGTKLHVWSWDTQGPRAMLHQEQTEDRAAGPSCAWSPDGSILAWSPGPWSPGVVANDLYLFSDMGTGCISAAHQNGINGITFSPDGCHLVTVSLDRTLFLRDPRTGEAVALPWRCGERIETTAFHPDVALMAAGGTAGTINDFELASRLYLLRFSPGGSPQVEILQEITTESSVKSVAFSPDGKHLLMSNSARLSLFRVHLS